VQRAINTINDRKSLDWRDFWPSIVDRERAKLLSQTNISARF
jgi:hypothetical protein